MSSNWLTLGDGVADEQMRRGAAANPASPSTTVNKRWYAHVAGQTYGPYDRADIQRMVDSGQVQAADFLCVEGGSAWIPAKDDPVFGALFRARDRIPAPLAAVVGHDAIAVQTDDHAASPVAVSAGDDKARQELGDFFGPRADKYLAIYDKMRASNRQFVTAPNWLVLFTGFPWFFYRRMYVTGTLLIIVPLLAAYLLGFTSNAGISAGICVWANNHYVRSAIRRLKKADALGLVGEERSDYLRRAGGVSVVAGVLASVLLVAAVALAFFSVYLKHHKAAH